MNKNMRNALARLLTLLLIVIMLLAAVFSQANTQTTTSVIDTPTTDGSAVPPVVFPAVPSGGTPIISDYTYFHPTGLISLPHLVGWELAASNGNETVEPSDTVHVTRVGSTFINSTALSVVHVFAEKDPTRKVSSVQDLDGFYTKDSLNGAWANFTGGWKELNRRADGDNFIINFEMYLDNNTYLGRQISRLNGDWLMVMRLVSPNNNLQLLDSLQNVETSKYQLWPQVLNTPLNWAGIVDYVTGYLVKFPPEWKQVDGAPGNPFMIEGKLGTQTITITTRALPGKAVKTEDDAKAYTKATWPNDSIQTVKAATVNEASGFAVSYISVDADGNRRSSVATLLNGTNGTLYTLNIQTSARDQDLLDPANSSIPVELTQIRNSFFLLPADKLVPTLTPTVTPIPATPVPGTQPATDAPAQPTDNGTPIG